MAAKRGRGVSTTRGGGVAAKRGRPRKHPPKLVKDKVLDDDVLEPKHIRSLPKRFADGANDDEAMDIGTAAGPVEAAEVGSADNAETAPDPKKKRERRIPRTREQIDAGLAFIPDAPAPATENAAGSGEEEMGEEETAKMVKSLLGTESAFSAVLLTFCFLFC